MTIKISTAKIKKEWTDYNGHMNVAYYILIFDQNAAETLMTKLDMVEKEKEDLITKFISENKHSFMSENLIYSNKLKK